MFKTIDKRWSTSDQSNQVNVDSKWLQIIDDHKFNGYQAMLAYDQPWLTTTKHGHHCPGAPQGPHEVAKNVPKCHIQVFAADALEISAGPTTEEGGESRSSPGYDGRFNA